MRMLWLIVGVAVCGAAGSGAVAGEELFEEGAGGFRLDPGVRGLSIGGAYVAEWSGVASGGVSRRGSFRDMLTIDAEADLGELLGIDGGRVFAQYLSVHPERGGSRDSGDIQVYSNLENDYHLDVVYELWYEQELLDGGLRLKIGKVDANTEFAYVGAAGNFSNSSAGFSPTIFALATYPDPATSVNVFARIFESTDGTVFTLGYGVYDGAAGADGVRTGNLGPATFLSDERSDDLLHILQGELEWDGVGGLGGGRLSVGGWHHTGEFDRFGGGREAGTEGIFVTAEQGVSDRVTVFGQYGLADHSVSEFGQHIAGGVVLEGLVPGRDADEAGVYVSFADLSDAGGAGFGGDEMVVDAYYRIDIGGSAYIQPEVQFIDNPSGGGEAGHALVLGVRIGVGF